MFEKLISQSWRDVQYQIHEAGEYAGISLDPFNVDNLVNSQPTVDLSDSNMAYSVNLKMWDIQVHGLSSIFINDVLVTRSKNLFDFDVKVEFKFSQLRVNGSYNIAGQLGGWFGTSFTSDGDRSFRIDINNATITPTFRLDTSEDKMECSKVVTITTLDDEIFS